MMTFKSKARKIEGFAEDANLRGDYDGAFTLYSEATILYRRARDLVAADRCLGRRSLLQDFLEGI